MATVELAQHLQLRASTYVNHVVELEEDDMKAMAHSDVRRFVKVAPPTVHAGVGDALRQAFRMDGETRSLAPFEDLIERLG